MALQIARKHFTIEEYYQMANAGIFSEDDRVELIDGEIIEMIPIGSLHAACVGRLTNLFGQLSKNKFIVWVQNPLRIDNYSEPEPDITLLKPRNDFYALNHPEPNDALLVIEVADTTLDYDRKIKIPLYARAGIPEAWLANLTTGAIEVYCQPTANGYQSVRSFKRGETITLQMLVDITVDVAAILG